MADNDYATGGFETAVHAQKGGNVHLWWRKISGLPTAANQAEVRRVVDEDATTYKAHGFKVEVIPADIEHADDIDMHVAHKHTPTPDEVAVLKGMAASTWIRAGWAGGA